MGSQWSRDKVYIRAKHEGFRSRASFKLIEIQEKFAIIRCDDNIIDIGAAPVAGSRCFARSLTGRVLGIDLNPIAALDGIETIEGDLTERAIQQRAQRDAWHGQCRSLRCLPKTLGPQKLRPGPGHRLRRRGPFICLQRVKDWRELCDQIVSGCGLSRNFSA